MERNDGLKSARDRVVARERTSTADKATLKDEVGKAKSMAELRDAVLKLIEAL